MYCGRHLIMLLVFLPTVSYGSDHIDRLTRTPSLSDISDLNSWKTSDGKLVLGLNTFMHPINANPAPEFDGSVEFRFEIRKVSLREPTQIEVTRAVPGTDTSDPVPAVMRDSRLRVPVVNNDFSANVTCTPIGNAPNCTVNIAEKPSDKVVHQAYTGRRADSFILDVTWPAVHMPGVIDPNIPASEPNVIPDARRIQILDRMGLPHFQNFADAMNVLNLTVEIDVQGVLGPDTQLVAVAAEAYKLVDGTRERVDRVGRPEITNMTIGLSDVKKAYNRVPTFGLTEEQTELFEALIRYGVLGWDRKDGKNDWPHGPLGGELHDLLEILVLDTLIVDTTKACNFSDQTFLAVERGAGEHQSCGGRLPNDDVIDTLFSFYTGGPEAANDFYQDGADVTARRPTNSFPYFAAP